MTAEPGGTDAADGVGGARVHAGATVAARVVLAQAGVERSSLKIKLVIFNFVGMRMSPFGYFFYGFK